MSAWGEFALAWVAFLFAHAMPARPAIRSRLTGLLGERIYLAVYIALSLALLGWLLQAAGRAPFLLLWDAGNAGRWIALPLAFFAFQIAALGIGAPNPFSFGGGDPSLYEPERPGILALTRHPLLVAILLWSLAHLIANGDVAHALLFGSFGAFALIGMRTLNRRRKKSLGAEAWAGLLPKRSFVNAWRHHPDMRREILRKLTIGAICWLTILHAHGTVLGVTPFPH